MKNKKQGAGYGLRATVETELDLYSIIYNPYSIATEGSSHVY